MNHISREREILDLLRPAGETDRSTAFIHAWSHFFTAILSITIKYYDRVGLNSKLGGEIRVLWWCHCVSPDGASPHLGGGDLNNPLLPLNSPGLLAKEQCQIACLSKLCALKTCFSLPLY